MEIINKNRVKKITICLIGILYIILCIKFNIGIPCIFHEITGFYCPGCGATRAITSLAKLDFYQAIKYNALVVALVPLFFIYLALPKKTKIPKI